MNVFLELAESTITQGFIYALLTYGIYITYKLLDFPDLSVEAASRWELPLRPRFSSGA